MAEQRGLALIGTLGVLAGAKRVGAKRVDAIERIAQLAQALREDGFWPSEPLVATGRLSPDRGGCWARATHGSQSV